MPAKKLLVEKDMDYTCHAKANWLSAENSPNKAYMIETSKLVVHDPDPELESAFNFAGFLRWFSDTT